MSLFGQPSMTSFGSSNNTSFGAGTTGSVANPNKDFEVDSWKYLWPYPKISQIWTNWAQIKNNIHIHVAFFFQVSNPSDDSISSLAFSPASLQQNFLVAGSWDNNVRFRISQMSAAWKFTLMFQYWIYFFFE